MSKAVLRFTKLKAGNLPGSSAHVSRQIDTPNADPERRQLNRTVGNSDARAGVLERVQTVTGGKYRKDAVVAYEFVMTAAAEWFADKSPKDVNQWAKASLKWLRKTFGSENLVSATLHLDEAAPHLHAYVVPEHEGRLRAKAYTGTRKQCSDLQTSYAKAVESFGLERGLKGSKAVHIPPQRFHALVNSQEVPDVPGPLSSSKKREEYRQTVAMQLAKQQAEAERLQRTNETLSKLLETIGGRDWHAVRQALDSFEKLRQSHQKTLQTLENTRLALEQSHRDQIRTEDTLRQYLSILDSHGIRSPEHLSQVIETAHQVIESNRQRSRSSGITLD